MNCCIDSEFLREKRPRNWHENANKGEQDKNKHQNTPRLLITWKKDGMVPVILLPSNRTSAVQESERVRSWGCPLSCEKVEKKVATQEIPARLTQTSQVENVWDGACEHIFIVTNCNYVAGQDNQQGQDREMHLLAKMQRKKRGTANLPKLVMREISVGMWPVR